MKKIIVFGTFFLGGLLLTGCSLGSVKENLDKVSGRIMQKDQQFEQGFVVTPELLTEHFKKDIGYLDLSKLGLTAIPEICKLMKPEELSAVEFLSLAQNKIRVVDQDLSCLTKLRVLNLSYNEISQVVTLGSLPALQELLLHKNELEKADAIVAMDLPALQKLSLAYNNLKTLSNVDRLKNLTVLELQHNALEAVVGVERLEKLQELKLEFNQLTDLPFLDKLQSIKSLTTEGNSLADTISNKAKAIQAKYIDSLRGGSTGTGETTTGN